MTTPRVIAILLAFALLAAACGGSNDDDASPDVDADATAAPEPTAEPEPAEADDEPAATPTPIVDIEESDGDAASGGTLRIGLEADVDGLNPTTSALSAPGITMAGAVFDTLMALDDDGNAVPYLAASIEPVDDELARWRLVLREGVTFHDGTPLNADAVRLNFESQVNSPLVGIAVRPFVPSEGAVEVIDDLTVEFQLLEGSAAFPSVLTSQLGMIASPTWLAEAAADPALNQLPVGTGPFKIENRSQDASTLVVRNDDWWNGEVRLDAVEFLIVVDPAQRGALLTEGALDGLHVNDPATVSDLFEAEEIQNVVDENGDETFLMINSQAAPFNDVRVRRALALATPLQNYRTLIGLGVARPADQMFIPESPFYNPDVVQEGDDPEGAAALAAEYCAEVPDSCTDGKIDMQYQYVGGSVTGSRIADLLAEGWESAFNVDYEELAQDAHIQQTALGQYEVVIWRGFGGRNPVNARINLMCRTVGGISINFARSCDEQRDALILEAQATTDADTRAALWQDIVANINEAYIYVFLTHTLWDTAFAPDVRGICDRTSPEGVPLRCTANGRMWFQTMWLDR